MKFSKITTVVILHIIICAFNIEAQSFCLSGVVRDAFTNSGIEDSYVILMNSDSTVVTSGFAKIPTIQRDNGIGSVRNEKDNTQGARFLLEVPQEGEYIISVSMLGYETACRSINLAPISHNKPVTIDDIYLIPKATDIDELTVTGTKLKVYHKGDTLVYDANAFLMDRHNVLEDLVKRLPGVELRDGRVFVNGRFVDNIVIGGKDFLKSDPQQIMAMLPAYVVDKLKFYDKSGEQSKTMGKDMHDSGFVMDVTMKRDYHGSWLGNIDIGAGTEKRWGGVGLVMHFDDRQAFSLSMDANNIGLARMATDLCTDIDNAADIEDSRNLQADLGYSFHPSEILRIDTHLKLRHIDKKEGNSEIFTSNADFENRIMRQSSKYADLRRYSFRGDAGITLRPRKGIFTRLNYSIDHGKENGTESSESLTGTGNEEVPDSLFADLLLPELPADLNLNRLSNVYRDHSTSDFHSCFHKASAETHLATGDNLLRISADFKIDDCHRMRHRDFLYRIFSENYDDKKILSLFDTRILTYRTNAGVDYDINYADNPTARGILTPFYRFEWFKENDDKVIYDNPSAGCPQKTDINVANSRWITGSAWRHIAGVSLKHEFQIGESGKWMMLQARIDADFERKEVKCTTADNIKMSDHDYILLSPEISIRWNPKSGDRRGSKSSLELQCKMTQTSPAITDLAEFNDTSDPMNIYSGNPDLRKQTSLETVLDTKQYFENSRSTLYATLRNRYTWDAVSMKSFYDMKTGIRTIMPINAGLGRETSLDLGYGLPISRQSWWLNLSARGSLTRCANLTVLSDISYNEPFMNFRSYITRVSIRHNAPSGKFMAGYMAIYQGNVVDGGSVSDSHLRSLIQNITLDLKIPASISFSANCNIISRFGYMMPSLDRTIFLLNASIEKSMCNDKLNFKLTAVDVFRQRKNAFSVIDGTGITKGIRTRFIPSYVMLSVYYRWSHTPRKKSFEIDS